MPCKFGSASSDGTELAWITKIDLIKVFKRTQIKDLLELLQKRPSLVKDVLEKRIDPEINERIESETAS